MKKSCVLSALLFLLLAAVAPAQETGGKPAKPESLHDKASYAIGLSIGKNFKAQKVDINLDYLIQGLKDATSGSEPLLTDQELQETMQAFQKEMMAKQQDQRKAESEKNKKEGADFLAANKAKEGVVTLDDGLQYKVLEEGSGPNPGPDDKVTVNYKGTLVDGTEFDSSYKRGKPATFPVKGVIPGFSEALQKMKVGSKWQVVIPSDLAYGERGGGNVIGPDATLVFEIELLSIDKGGAKPAEKPQDSGSSGGSSGGGH